jgi:hypothetical protein
MPLDDQVPVLSKQDISWLILHASNEHIEWALLQALLREMHFIHASEVSKTVDTVRVEVVVALTD